MSESTPCGDGPDARYCAKFWEQNAELESARAELAHLRERAEWYESERIRLRELLNEASIAEPVTAGTEHLIDPGDPRSWQKVADMPARER